MSGFGALGALTALLVLGGPAQAADKLPEELAVVAATATPADPPPAIRDMTEDEQAGAACVASSIGMTSFIYAFGPSEFMMLVVGGVIVPSSSSVLFVGLLTTISSMACSAGAALTPIAMWGWRQLTNPGGQAKAAGDDPTRPGTGRSDSAASGAGEPATAGRALVSVETARAAQ